MRFKPYFDKTFKVVLFLSSALCLMLFVALSFVDFFAMLVCLACALLTAYFIISPLFGYAELRDKTLYVKFGIIMEKEIEYSRITRIKRGRGFYSDSFVSLKNSMEHITVWCGIGESVTLSVVDNDRFATELEERIAASRGAR